MVALMATSCQKEEMGRVLTATIEQYEHNGKGDGVEGSKAYINGDYYACWEPGDLVSINGTRCTVSIPEGNNQNNTVTIEGQIPTDQNLMAFHPASQVRNLTSTGGTVKQP